MEITREKAQIFKAALRDLSPDEISRGVRAFCLAHTEIYPGTNVIAHIRKYALGHKNQMTAAEAWGLVNKEISAKGSYGKPEFDSPLVSQSVEVIGWRNLCLSDNDVADRAHFFQIYNSLLEKNKFNELAAE